MVRRGLLTGALVSSLVGLTATAHAASFGTLDPNTFCTRPAVPRCMLAEETFSSPEAQHACDDQAAAFVKDLSGYRSCMIQESQRTVSEANDLLSHYRCRRGQTERCPTQDPIPSGTTTHR